MDVEITAQDVQIVVAYGFNFFLYMRAALSLFSGDRHTEVYINLGTVHYSWYGWLLKLNTSIVCAIVGNN